MKLFGLILIFSLLNSLTAHARLGQTYQQLVDQFGQPTVFNKVEKYGEWEFEDKGFHMVAYFDNAGVCGLEVWASYINEETEYSILEIHELHDKVKAQLPAIEFRQIKSGVPSKFGGATLASNPEITYMLSPVTERGRLAIGLWEEEKGRGSMVFVLQESFVRTYIRKYLEARDV